MVIRLEAEVEAVVVEVVEVVLEKAKMGIRSASHTMDFGLVQAAPTSSTTTVNVAMSTIVAAASIKLVPRSLTKPATATKMAEAQLELLVG